MTSDKPTTIYEHEMPTKLLLLDTKLREKQRLFLVEGESSSTSTLIGIEDVEVPIKFN